MALRAFVGRLRRNNARTAIPIIPSEARLPKSEERMAASEFVLGLVQMRCGTDPGANMEKAVVRVHEAARQGAEMVCLPELFLSPYFCNTHDPKLFDLAEPIPGPRTETLSRAAKSAGV